ncbi:hypothetical protein IOD16_30270 [Saccharothrix sp. 6-C]|uniref:hypothetical protein n=1 Tax=Saccharothrix sp. 6-C TaxID=2781735 RepID=UPI0019171512|nr:hypothetical protein [Saccharothrix sp. 6-C]QQQ75348.1 hypothetical protein IOD16_30270 [Saccharothrix sp. 6-C]
MRKIATIGTVLAVVLAVAVIPAASAQRQSAEPPAACAGLVAQLADTLKKVVEPLAATPPAPDKAAVPLGDVLRLLVAMTAAKCLPTPPMTGAAEVRFHGPELCLSHDLAMFAGAFSVLSKLVPGAVPPDPGKLRAEAQTWLKVLNEALKNCGLPVPEGGMPTMPDPARSS